MRESRIVRAHPLMVVIVLVGSVTLSGCAQTTGGGPAERSEEPAVVQPWEWWRDLATIASVSPGDRVVMRSSHCPSGCEFDRHSAGDSRFLRTNSAGEGVIFETEGAGAVTRIWMVMGRGTSERLDTSIRIRIRIDGGPSPVVDLPLPALFDGSTEPFLAPLVADIGVSGGGNVSYVPIPFRDGCEVSLVGAEHATIWYQVTARLVDDPTGIRPFSKAESFGGLRAMLNRVGGDPWQGEPSPTVSGSAILPPGGSKLIATLDGPDFINGILIRVPRRNWHRLGLRLTFDGGEPQLIPLLDLMGVMRPDGGTTMSLLMGADGDDDLYCYFPMPFFERATVELMRRPVEGPGRVTVEYAIRTAGRHPPVDAGIFRVQIQSNAEDPPGGDHALFETAGKGKWVGSVADIRRTGVGDWSFLEGDEWVAVNGEEIPSWRGTGVEDLFNGGFYFRDPERTPTPFSTALAGAPFLSEHPVAAVMYRLLLGDAVAFSDGIRAGLETDPTEEPAPRTRTVTYLYTLPTDESPASGEPER